MEPALLSQSPEQPSNRKQSESVAILKLLSDDDPETVALVLEQLESDASGSTSRLESLYQQATGKARKLLASELERLRIGDPRAALLARCDQIETLADFEDFCWKMALYHDPRARLYEARELLDLWAQRVRDELPPSAAAQEQLAALRLVLARQEKLRGNEENYYDPENSFLDKVMDSRQGLPISLTAIYMFVGERAGIIVDPLGMPGHFLAHIGSCYFTPFGGGADVERAKLEESLLETGLSLEDSLLHNTPLPLIAQRMINNLTTIYGNADDMENLQKWQVILTRLQEVSL